MLGEKKHDNNLHTTHSVNAIGDGGYANANRHIANAKRDTVWGGVRYIYHQTGEGDMSDWNRIVMATHRRKHGDTEADRMQAVRAELGHWEEIDIKRLCIEAWGYIPNNYMEKITQSIAGAI